MVASPSWVHQMNHWHFLPGAPMGRVGKKYTSPVIKQRNDLTELSNDDIVPAFFCLIRPVTMVPVWFLSAPSGFDGDHSELVSVTSRSELWQRSTRFWICFAKHFQRSSTPSDPAYLIFWKGGPCECFSFSNFATAEQPTSFPPSAESGIWRKRVQNSEGRAASNVFETNFRVGKSESPNCCIKPPDLAPLFTLSPTIHLNAL